MSSIVIGILSSNAVITLIAGAFATHLVKWLASNKGKGWEQYIGWAETAVRAAEKAIPDDLQKDTGMWKLNYALRAFLDKYEKAVGYKIQGAQVDKIESWISEVHTMLETAGLLGGTEADSAQEGA